MPSSSPAIAFAANRIDGKCKENNPAFIIRTSLLEKTIQLFTTSLSLTSHYLHAYYFLDCIVMAPILMPVAKALISGALEDTQYACTSFEEFLVPIVTEPTISHLFRGELKNPLQNGSTDVIVKYISQTGDSTSGEDLLQHLYVSR
jgi:hypothetical protein